MTHLKRWILPGNRVTETLPETPYPLGFHRACERHYPAWLGMIQKMVLFGNTLIGFKSKCTFLALIEYYI
jgi:hypothetical protein